MAFADDMVVDHNVLLHQDHDDGDILSEFLDQRVFDSVNGNTPLNSNGVSPLHQDFDSIFHKLKHEDDLLDEGQANTMSQDISPDQNYLYDASHENFERESFANDSPKHSPNDSTLATYEAVRKEVSNIKFGTLNQKVCPDSLELEDSSYLDFSPETMKSLPYNLEVLDLPTYSRVETQTKLRFNFSPPPKETLVRIPQDLVSKTKHCLQNPVDALPEFLKENMLFMDTYVLTSDGKTSCNICKRCIKREQKRASRSKSGPADAADSPNSSMNKNLPNMWSNEDMVKKAIIYNSKEIVSFAPPTGLMDDPCKSLDFSIRIVCYCRHHKEQNGFKLLFVVKNYSGEVVAKHLSDPIMIMDRKKNQSGARESTSAKPRIVKSEDLNGEGTDGMHPLSPNSIDDSNSEALVNTDTNTDSFSGPRGTKRKKMSFDDSGNNSGNPMYNGSTGLSPLSNSDTNTSIHNMNSKNGLHPVNKGSIHGSFTQSMQASPIPRQRSQQSFGVMQQASNHPMIQKIIPAQGPIRGGIEVTLLGFNFRPGLNVKFGSKNSLATHCWSESTMVTYLPPAAQPGQVLVSFESLEHVIPVNQQSIFTYTDDTDRQLIELALQIVGLKMNGKLEDAKNIAKRIVGSDSQAGSSGNTPSQQTNVSDMNQASKEWYDNAHKAVEQLVKSELSTEEILINFLSLVDLPNCPIIIPNWQLCNNQGQSLLHLATLKNYTHLIKFLLTHGCKIDIKDNQGLTPLFFASMCGHRDLMKVFIECKSNWNMRLANDKFLKDYCDINVLDVFSKLEAENYTSDDVSSVNNSGRDAVDDELTKSYSVDSLNSLFMIDYGKHISKMVIESSTEEAQDSRDADVFDRAYDSVTRPSSPDGYGDDSSDFADSELDSDDDFSDHDREPIREHFRNGIYEDDDYDDDYKDYESSDANDSDESGDEDRDSERLPDASKKNGLWQKMKNAVFHSDNSDAELPSYDDLFPFGHSSVGEKPKTQQERALSEQQNMEGTSATRKRSATEEDAGLASDSSEDMVISYINHPRKTVESDKMLLFFWLPILVFIIGLFLYVGITGQKVGFVEKFKEMGRDTIGNFMVGNERITRVFRKEAVNRASKAIKG
ncbi:hypothetical_protein [Candidozyma auris]|uniref:hypothetical_protein n=1 Tax=Candidozyma auris TaxID=498019 RepID=UPI000D2CEC97|nr:hypothetical_protein [[Candida] auris]QEO21631.1 hypothetical_protein [[Candida] auris]GBL47868.1 hypothetical protein CAJCM15448_01420 [[Candida] auris]